MATFHTSLFIPRPPADVFSFVSDFRRDAADSGRGRGGVSIMRER